jgi:mannose-6-phosphate isomerase-like protein (cupin superfamily)
MKLVFVLIAAMVVPAMGQTSSKAEVFTSQKIQAQLADLLAKSKAGSKGTPNVKLGEYKTHFLRLVGLASSGGAEVHPHYDDVIVVVGGTATLVTGGSIVGPHAGKDDEVQGASIKDGESQKISAGDIAHIPAGTPHQLLIGAGGEFTAFVVKIRE